MMRGHKKMGGQYILTELAAYVVGKQEKRLGQDRRPEEIIVA